MLIGEPSGEGEYWGSESPTPYRKRTMLTSEPLLHSLESSNRLVAACMLAALESETEVDATEKAVLEYLRAGGHIPEDSGYVEHGCLEHEVVHVSFYPSPEASTSQWVCIDPEDGTISEF